MFACLSVRLSVRVFLSLSLFLCKAMSIQKTFRERDVDSAEFVNNCSRTDCLFATYHPSETQRQLPLASEIEVQHALKLFTAIFPHFCIFRYVNGMSLFITP